MLELSCCVRFAVDVGDLLHLKRALHADRIVDAAADEEDILLCCELAREPLDPLLVFECLLDLIGDAHKLSEELLFPLFIDGASYRSKLDRKNVCYCELCAVCLGRGYGDLGTCESIECVVCLTCDGRTYDVDDSQSFDAEFLALSKSRKRVCSLA